MHCPGVDLISIYECLCDRTRLRILNLLCKGPLCVCHFQELLKEPQVKISKHLKYLRTHGMVEVKRDGYWMIYSIPAKPTRELKANLGCLQDCVREDATFRQDLQKLEKIRAKFEKDSPIASSKALCC
jgi:ArsR family transcriptional regulator